MSPSDGHEKLNGASGESVESQLFESLVHHLIEKGVLTRNDALSVLQTVAQVKRGEIEEGREPGGDTAKDLSLLKRLYSSFELMPDGSIARQTLDGENVHRLRPPLHADRPSFPRED